MGELIPKPLNSMSLEAQRAALEELQTIEAALAERIARNPEISPHFAQDEHSLLHMKNKKNQKKKRSFKEVLLQQHEMQRFVENYKKMRTVAVANSQQSDGCGSLTEGIEDKTFELKEFDALFNKINTRGDDASNGMVKGLRQIYSMKSSNWNILSEIASDLELNKMFSGEEYFGKYLDLIALHERWLNLSVDKLSYIKYLGLFDDFESHNIIKRDSGDYVNYLGDLSNYLCGYIRRSKPLFALDKLLQTIETDFNSTKQEQSTTTTNSLFCKACNKNFAKQTVFDAHLTGKKHIKNSQRTSQPNERGEPQLQQGQARKARGFKFLEYQISKLVEVVNKERQDTKLNTERRKALTERERLIELDKMREDEYDGELSGDESSGDDEGGDNDKKRSKDGNDEENNMSVYNPMNLPLGADGQPIPHWLYKLHGLDIEYVCEICSNYSYKGRRAFDTHFLETRHIHGLKCLGIQQPQKFKNITKISDVQALWEKMKQEQKLKEAEKENAVEMEDEEGNVMSEKVYNDLKKQGLI